VPGLYESASAISPLRPLNRPLTSKYLQAFTLFIVSMRLFSLLFLLAPLALAHAPSNATPETRATRKPFNPPIPEGGILPVTGTLHERSPTTNAARLAHGLSPLRPRALLTPSRAQNGKCYGLRVDYPLIDTVVPRADPSASPVAGYVQVIDADTGDSYGYIARVYNTYGEIQMVSDLSDALHVSFTPLASADTPFSMGATNALASSLPFVGGVVGYSSSSDNVGSDTGAYYYLAGTTEGASASVSRRLTLTPAQSRWDRSPRRVTAPTTRRLARRVT
jgi:hypothetical protein